MRGGNLDPIYQYHHRRKNAKSKNTEKKNDIEIEKAGRNLKC